MLARPELGDEQLRAGIVLAPLEAEDVATVPRIDAGGKVKATGPMTMARFHVALGSSLSALAADEGLRTC